MLPFVLFTAAAVAALLAAEAWQVSWGRWVAKPLASTGFVAASLAEGALETPYGRGILLALALSWLGDMLLLPRGSRGAFLAGLGSFLLGHLVFAAAFATQGRAAQGLVPALGLTGVALLLALRWLGPHVPARMRVPVRAYMAVVSIMVVCAAGATAATGELAILVGAGLFYVSDLAVARERFVAPGFRNRAWGLPAYYAAQLVLASTAGAV